jgi:hypothetical protein
MKKTVVAALTFFALLLGASMALAHHGPEVINMDKFKKAMAPVKFQHHQHQDRVNMDCIVCHHKEKAGETKLKPCSECHPAKAGDGRCALLQGRLAQGMPGLPQRAEGRREESSSQMQQMSREVKWPEYGMSRSITRPDRQPQAALQRIF